MNPGAPAYEFKTRTCCSLETKHLGHVKCYVSSDKSAKYCDSELEQWVACRESLDHSY